MRKDITRGRHRSPARTAIAFALLCLPPAWAAAAQDAPSSATRASIDIPAGELAGALDRLSAQTGLAFMYQPGLVAGKHANALSGQLTWREALGRLLEGSGLQYRQVNATTVVIRGAEGRTKPASRPAPASSASAAAGEEPEVTEIQSVTVTGTRIRGGVTASPTVVVGAEDIKEEGFSDLGEVIRSIPQNYSGGQNPGVAGGASSVNIANQNITSGSSLNLRGLGPDASLTLLNGKRLSYDGFVQAIDISAIPVEAVERLEVVPDGASALYGSDAVGGVANVILKRQSDGVTLGARHGASADGGLTTNAYTATAGTTWSTGGLLATFLKADQDPIYATQRSYTQAMYAPTTIHAGHSVWSALLSGYQAIGDVAELRLDALKTVRDMTSMTAYAGFYSLGRPTTKVSLVSPEVQFYLPGGWVVSTSYTRGKDRYESPSYRVAPSASTLSSQICYCNESSAWEIGGEGPLFHLGDHSVRLATGIGARRNEYLKDEYVPITHTTGTRGGYGGHEQSRFIYGELAIPMVSSTDAQAGVYRLEFTAAARSEDYNSFGRVTTPKMGAIYGPTPDVSLKATWGKSFKAPTLLQQHQSRISYLYPVGAFGVSGYPTGSTVLVSYGGNPDLKPERAKTWTASLVFHPVSLPGLNAELSYFNIDYSDRVIQPVVLAQALSNPVYAQFVTHNPTQAQQEKLLAKYGEDFLNSTGAAYDASKVVAIVQDQYVNVTRQKVEGWDLSGSYRFDLGLGTMEVRGAASWLESLQQNSTGQAYTELAGTLYRPAKLNGRIGALWHNGGFSASGFVNYTQGVTSTVATFTGKTASFTTFDTTLRYVRAPGVGSLDGIEISLAVQNLFNRAPPLFTPSSYTYVPYDSTNYSAIGRFANLSISKHW